MEKVAQLEGNLKSQNTHRWAAAWIGGGGVGAFKASADPGDSETGKGK